MSWNLRNLISDSFQSAPPVEQEQSGFGVLTRRQVAAAAQQQEQQQQQHSEAQNNSENNEENDFMDFDSSPTSPREEMEQDDVQSGRAKSPPPTEVEPQPPVPPPPEALVDAAARDTSDTLFNNETLVAENSSVAAYVVKQFHRHQKIFSLDDHLYELHFKKKQDEPIYLRSIESILEKSLEAILTNLKTFYNSPQETNLLYMTIAQKNLNNAIRSGVYVLQDNNTSDMLKNIMINLNRFINSNESIQLDDSFQVYFKVLSNAHFLYPKNRRKAVPIRTIVGSPADSECFLKGGLLNVPAGFPEKKDAFLNKCLLAAVILNYAKLVDTEIYGKLKRLCYSNKSDKQKNEAGKSLLYLINELCSELQINSNGPHNLSEVLPQICLYLNIRVYVIGSMDGETPDVECYPDEKHDFEVLRIYLYLHSENHVVMIDNLKTFFNENKRKICFSCKRFFSYYWTFNLHDCKNQSNCGRCLEPILTPKTKVIKEELTQFCDSKLAKESEKKSVECTNCNFLFETQACYNNHFKACKYNHTKIKCKKCDVYYQIYSSTSRQQAEAEHECGVVKRRCPHCREVTLSTQFHICKLKKCELYRTWPNLGFINMKFQNVSCGKCQNCFDLRQTFMRENNLNYKELFAHPEFSTLLCDRHKTISSDSEPNVINMYLEEEKRFHYKEYLFKDNKIIEQDIITSELDFKYCDDDESKPLSSETLYANKKTKQSLGDSFYNNLKKRQSLKIQQNNICAMDNFIAFICDKNRSLKNYTFIVEHEKAMFSILQAFLAENLMPRILQRGSTITLIEVSGLQIRFLNRSSYLAGNIFEIGNQYNLKFTKKYFPDLWNEEKQYNYIGTKPNLSDFYCYSDTKVEKMDKAQYYLTVPLQQWNFKKELISSLQNETFVLVQAMLCFLKQCFDLQQTLSVLTKKPANAIHPFGGRLLTLSGFSFSLYRFYFQHDEMDVRTVLNPYTSCSTQTSRQEFEYVSFLNWQKSDDFIQGALNCPEGQKRFGRHFVDGYSAKTKTVYQFRGLCNKIMLICKLLNNTLILYYYLIMCNKK